jgi:SAM-dependent methyltransferase
MLSTTIRTLPATTNRMSAFTEWCAEYCTPDALVLDIGAGYDRNGVDAALQPLVARLVGIDPSEKLNANPSLDERYQITLEEFARIEERKFRFVLATWVLEHVSAPSEFFSACHHLLEPDGMFFAITPNLWHYFGLIAKSAASLGVEDWILDRIIGPERKAEYHSETRYRMNSILAIKRLLQQNGFQSGEFRCCDGPADYDYVIPQPLRWFPRLYSRLVYQLHLPSGMEVLMFRATTMN